MKNVTIADRLFALCAIACVIAGIVLIIAGRYLFGGLTLYVGATMCVLTFIRCASIISKRAEDKESV